MNPITSSTFREKNQILHKNKILQDQGVVIDTGYQPVYQAGHVDVIDINNNNKADFTKFSHAKGGIHSYTFSEPTLSVAYSKVEEYAKNNETEVLTQDDIKNLQLGTTFIEHRFPERDTVKIDKHRPVTTLVNEVQPFEQDAKWAIDVKTQEFLFFKPKG